MSDLRELLKRCERVIGFSQGPWHENPGPLLNEIADAIASLQEREGEVEKLCGLLRAARLVLIDPIGQGCIGIDELRREIDTAVAKREKQEPNRFANQENFRTGPWGQDFTSIAHLQAELDELKERMIVLLATQMKRFSEVPDNAPVPVPGTTGR